MATLNDLGKLVKAKHPEYAALPDLEVGRRVRAKYPNDYTDFSGAGPTQVTVRQHVRNMPSRGGGASWPDTAPQTSYGQPIEGMNTTRDILTGVAGGVGTLLAPEAAVPAEAGLVAKYLPGVVSRATSAFLAGGGARATSDALTETLSPPGSALTEGGKQAAYSVGGDALAGGLAGVGKAGMGAALRFTPEVAQTAIREGITYTKQGVGKLMARMGEYGDRTLAMLRHSTRLGTRFDPVTFLNGAEQSLAAKLAENRTPEAFGDLATFRNLSSDFLRLNQGELTPLQLHTLKHDSDIIADPIWKKIANKEEVSGPSLARARWYKSVGDHARDMLEQTTPDMIDPATGQTLSLAQSNAQTASLIKLKQVIAPEIKGDMGLAARAAAAASTPAARAVAGAATGAALPADSPQGRIEHALAGVAVTNPTLLSMLGLVLNHPGLLKTVSQLPRAAGMAASH